MQFPVQISYRSIQPSAAIDECIRAEAEKLAGFYHRIMGCRVMVEVPHRHHRRGNRCHVRIDLTIPGGEIVVKHEPTLHRSRIRTGDPEIRKEHEVDAPHKDLFLAIRDAFQVARRRLQDFGREQQGAVKRRQTEVNPAPGPALKRVGSGEGG